MSTLTDLAAATAQRSRMAEDAAYADDKWRRLIVELVTAGIPHGQVAKAAGVSRPRVYQIAEGKR